MQNAQVNVVAENQVAAVVLETVIGTDAGLEVVPLGRLVKSPFNVRKQAPTRIGELAENIRAKGLLQNLVVHKLKGRTKTAKYGVAAGQRRMLALQSLAERGIIDADYGVSVKIVSDAEAVEISLSENTERERMHPADEFLAFKALLDEGKSIEYVAALFGIAPTTVVRRMKLVGVSPKLFELFAADQISIEQLIALTVSDDHEAQETVWFATAQQSWMREPHQLRARLTADKIDIRKSRIVRFVGLVEFEAAGGIIERDLFSEDEAGYISDSGLLMRLHDAKLSGAAETIKAEGWAWVETRAEFDYTERQKFGQLYAIPRPLTEEEAQSLQALIDERDATQQKLDVYYDAEEGQEGITGDEANSLEDKVADLTDKIETIEDRDGDFSAEQMGVAGAILYVGYHGTVEIERGLVKKEDKAAAREAGHEGNSSGLSVQSSPAKEKGIHSEKLTKQLTAYRTVAIQSELAARPDVALAVMVHKLVVSVFKDGYYGGYEASAAQISVTVVDHQLTTAATDVQASDAWKAVKAQHKDWRAKLPKDANEFFPWILEQTLETQLALLAFCTAVTIDGVSGLEKAHPVNAVAGALGLDMSKHWTATAEGYFNHVSKARIAEVLSAAVSPEAANEVKAMKKADAAAFAESRVAPTGWTPEVFSATNAPVLQVYGADDADDENAEIEDDAAETTPQESVFDMNEGAADKGEASHDEPLNPAIAWPFPNHSNTLRNLSRRATH